MREPRLVTVLLRLPLFYNPDAQAGRELVDDEKFIRTAEEIAQQFGGGTLFMFRREDPRGFWWDQGVVDRDTLALLLLKRFRQKAIYLKFIGPVETLLVTDEEVASES
jgi:hypothetical protein